MRKSILLILSIIVCAGLAAQVNELNPGDVITGTVYGRVGPLAGANVIEDDSVSEYYNIAITDSLGRFTMTIHNPHSRFWVNYGAYELQYITPISTPMEIKLEPYDITNKKGKYVPETEAGGRFIKADYNYVSRQPIIPKEFICGYAIHPINYAEQMAWYSIFLHKDQEGYMVILHYCGGGCADTLRIDDRLATRLSESVKLAVEKAPSEYFKPDDGLSVITLHEGTDVYAVVPGQAAVIWDTEIPDRVWNKLYHQFGKNLGYKPVKSTWVGDIDLGNGRVHHFPKTYDDAYAVISYVNRLRYRYDLETGQAVVEYNKGYMPSGNLVIEPSVTSSIRTFPVTTIDAGALENCTGLESVEIPASVTSIGENAFRFCELDYVTLHSVNPIACPVSAFDESVYENAVLNVPKGWKQKKAAKIGPAWGKFKQVVYY